MTASSLPAARVRTGNPFPGLRPFEQHEASLFFGRDEQYEELLARLSHRRFVAVVGMSGSGKSSLVRAGLLPALERGYMPAAGSSWQVAVFRPGSDPIGNLARGLAERRLPAGDWPAHGREDIQRLLEASSFGLSAAAQRLLADSGDSLLIVADQFEELFRFSSIALARESQDEAAACVDLLVNASRQESLPVYVVITMRSDYLGQCSRFTGLPETLNDSQFLLPRMTRAQLRAAIEGPIAVAGARITPRLVQRLLYDVDELAAGRGESSAGRRSAEDQDQLPVLQHALMRVWEVARPARERGEPLDLPHYDKPPVETIHHALDHHAEEVYSGLPTDAHREIARLIFQQLADRDPQSREVRRPTPLRELSAVALRTSADRITPAQQALVDDVIAAFSGEGRAFVVVTSQQDVDISHESFIRGWVRLHNWVDRESRSGRIYTKLAACGASWERGEASLYRGPELAEARSWWKEETPSAQWATRYDPRFDVAHRFLARSIRGRRLRRTLFFGNIGLVLTGALAFSLIMAVLRREAQDARLAEQHARYQVAEAYRLLEDANAALKRGERTQAASLEQRAQQIAQQVGTSSPPEVDREEVYRLRQELAEAERVKADLRQQLDARIQRPPGPEEGLTKPPLQPPDVAELERLRRAETSLEREVADLRQQLTAANERAARAQATSGEGPGSPGRPEPGPARAGVQPPPLPAEPAPARAEIDRLMREYRAAYEALDAAAVNRLMPSASRPELARAFSQLRSYQMEISNPQVTVSGDTATVTCVRSMAIQPKVGTRQTSRPTPIVMLLRRTPGGWIIESIEERR